MREDVDQEDTGQVVEDISDEHDGHDEALPPIRDIYDETSQGGCLGQLCCLLALHDWTRWSEPEEAVYGLWSDPDQKFIRIIQERTCRACGKVGVRRL